MDNFLIKIQNGVIAINQIKKITAEPKMQPTAGKLVHGKTLAGLVPFRVIVKIFMRINARLVIGGWVIAS